MRKPTEKEKQKLREKMPQLSDDEREKLRKQLGEYYHQRAKKKADGAAQREKRGRTIMAILATVMFAILGGFIACYVGFASVGDSEWAFGVFFIHVPVGVIAGAIIGNLLFHSFWRRR